MEATVQTLTTPLPGEEPFIGDGAEGELVTNTADGRLWVADVAGNPIELGGACVNRPINGNLFAGNYLDLDVTNPDNLPVPVPDPNNVPAGFYRELRILLRFVGTPLETFTTYFDYDVDWGGGSDPSTYAVTGALVLVELCAFGPSPAWLGRVVWYRSTLRPNDLTPVISLIPVREGQKLDIDFVLPGLVDGTVVYWSLSGANITSSDFLGGSLTGQGVVSGGIFSFSETVLDDGTAEPPELLNIKLFYDQLRSNQIGRTFSITIRDPETPT